MKNVRTSFLLIASIALLASCGDKNTTQTSISPVSVKTEKISESTFKHIINLSGNIEGNTTVRLGFMVAGKIDRFTISEGESVRKGQLVATLESESYSIANELATIQVNQTEDEYDRLKKMHATSSISESDFAKIGFGLQQAKAQQRLQAKNLADTKLTSPIDGVLLKKLAETGEITPVGNPVLVIADISKVKVNAFIPENELNTIRIGADAEIYIAALDTSVNGKVVEVGAAADPTSRTFSVKIEVENKQQLLKPGMIAEVSIPQERTGTSLVVPIESILHDNDGENYLFVIDPKKNIAFKRKVSLGQLTGDKIEIVSGVRAGEIIVTGGQNKLTDGSPIRQ